MMGDLLDSPFGNNQGGVGFTTISLNDEENNNNNNDNSVVPTWPNDDSPITVRSGRRCSVLLFPTLLVLFTIAAAVFNHNSSGSTMTSPEMPVSWDDDYEMILSSDKKEEVLDDIAIIEQQLDSFSGAASQDDDSIELEKEALEDTEEELIGEVIEKEELSGGSLDVDDDEVIVEDIEKEVEEITKDNNKSNQDIKQEKKEKLDETAASNLIHIKSSAMTTIKKSSPTSKDGGMVNFSVEGDERISFVRFELPSSDVSKNGGVEKATLNLYLTKNHKDSNGKHQFTVNVEALPHGGKWTEGKVSWNESQIIKTRGSFMVNSFHAKRLSVSGNADLYEVDVSSAINVHSQRITFKLSMEERSDGRLDFAGKTWKGGDLSPELVLTMSK